MQMTNKTLVFLGTNNVLERYIEAAERQSQPIAGIIDSDWYDKRTTFADIPVLADLDALTNDLHYWRSNHVFFVGTNWIPENFKIGQISSEVFARDRDKRSKLCTMIDDLDLPCINLIDPASYVSRYAKLGKGIFIGDNVGIEPFVQIEDFAQCWSGAVVGHHSRIGRNTIIQRNAGLYGRIGSDSYIGIGSAILRDGTSVAADNVVVATGLAVFRDVQSGEYVQLDGKSAKTYRRTMPIT